MTNVHYFRFFCFWAFVAQVNFVNALGESVPYELLKQLLPTNAIVVEAGAQFGEDTLWMSEFWPMGKIHAFEPSPNTYPSVVKVAESCTNVQAYQLALSSEKGEFAFYLAGGASSLLRPQDSFNTDYFHCDVEHPIIVQVDTLDNWAKEKCIEKIDFLWLDMEGNELNALKGGVETLRNVKLIYTEVNLQRFWEGCVMYHELKEWLTEQGFEEIWSDIVPTWHGNVLFINKGL